MWSKQALFLLFQALVVCTIKGEGLFFGDQFLHINIIVTMLIHREPLHSFAGLNILHCGLQAALAFLNDIDHDLKCGTYHVFMQRNGSKSNKNMAKRVYRVWLT